MGSPKGRESYGDRVPVVAGLIDAPDCGHDLVRRYRAVCRGRGPDDIDFATKPAQAAEMVYAALDADVPAGWVTADEVYGANTAFRTGLRERGVGYVLAVRSISMSPPAPDAAGSTPWPPHFRSGPGSHTAPGRARRAPATTTGPGSGSTQPQRGVRMTGGY